MNEERIDELAFEAGCHRHKYWDPKHPDLEGFIISQAVLDKFAELIVRECMKCSTWVGEVNKNLVEPVHTARAINKRISKQFGVDE